MMKKLAVVALSVACLAAAHPEGTLKSPRKSVEAGQTMPLTGESFLPGDPLQLLLRGALAEYALVEVTPNAEGKFSMDLAIPGNVRPGEYRVVALSTDGDITAELEVAVQAATPPAVAPAPATEQPLQGNAALDASADAAVTHPASGEHAGMAMPMVGAATAEELPIQRSRDGMEWGVLGLLIGLVAGAGVGLIRV